MKLAKMVNTEMNLVNCQKPEKVVSILRKKSHIADYSFIINSLCNVSSRFSQGIKHLRSFGCAIETSSSLLKRSNDDDSPHSAPCSSIFLHFVCFVPPHSIIHIDGDDDNSIVFHLQPRLHKHHHIVHLQPEFTFP